MIIPRSTYGVLMRRRPLHQRFINTYRVCRSFGLPRIAALRAAWIVSRSDFMGSPDERAQ